VVDYVRKITGERRVGHGGTLDPNATGLLIVGVGREATKKLGKIAKNTSKTYQAKIILGEERNTDDVEGLVVVKARGVLPPAWDEVARTVLVFKGAGKQVPPVYSAIKIGGRKAYELARKGKKVILEPRIIQIYWIKIIDYKYPFLTIEAKVSSGTYIRALARDIGRKLGMGAYLAGLRRTRIGKYSVGKALSLDQLNPVNWKKLAVSI